MKAILDLYSRTYLTAMGVPGCCQADREEIPEQGFERAEPVTLLVRIKRQVARAAQGFRRLDFDQYGMADWWLGF